MMECRSSSCDFVVLSIDGYFLMLLFTVCVHITAIPVHCSLYTKKL